jgi:hypothetical protein
MLVGTAVSVAPTISRMNSDLSYSDGRTLTFRITEKEEEGRSFYNPTETDVSIFDDGYVAVNAVAKEIRSRLDVWGVSGYEVDTVGFLYGRSNTVIGAKYFLHETTIKQITRHKSHQTHKKSNHFIRCMLLFFVQRYK